jgi:BolA protein
MTTETERISLIQQRLTAAFSPMHLEITDQSHAHKGHAGAQRGGHFTVHIVCPQFTGQTLLQRHRMVYAAVGDLMNQTIHALSIRAQTPDEFSQETPV